jgi:antitoxin ParD1/3/4
MASERLTITLTPELLEFVRERTAGGDYNSDSEVIRDGLRLLKERDQAVQRWLKEQVVPAYLKLKADPESALTREQSEARLAERRSQRRANKKVSAA